MKHAEHTETFERVLLSHAEMCYLVALALTHNPRRAEGLARHVLTRAWYLRNSVDGEKDIKRKLLRALRERFLRYHCPVSSDVNCEASIAEGM